MGCIYLVTNTINGKQYIGKTTDRLARRWIHHCNGRDVAHSLIDAAIQRYGEEAFTLETIEESNDEAILYEMEAFCIQELGTRIPRGYNLTDGGGGAPGRFRRDEHRRHRVGIKVRIFDMSRR